MTYEDVSLLCDLFYLPFEHGSAGTQILHDFNWLKTHAHVVCNSLLSNGCGADVSETTMKDPEVLVISYLKVIHFTEILWVYIIYYVFYRFKNGTIVQQSSMTSPRL